MTMEKHLLEEIIKTHHREAFFWARQCCGFDDDLAADVLQNSYLKILEGKASFAEKSSPKTWLFAVIRFSALESLRKKPKHESLDDQVLDFEAIEDLPSPDSHEELLLLLPERQREVLLLVFYHQLTIEKASEVMQVSLGTARTHYDRAKKNLKSLIENKQKHQDAE
jgi:RNA polymerase sigma factor (sigma-70 family)